ncbi:ATP-binding protein [Salinivibrio sp. ML290]|uniref:ATP-binding protein n=1 Tax=Salinivibrio sp. ML290 TaxID=1909468 RepID=UPI00098886DA|nr:ATP-binding protein [Salinivibrio sp. ML290]OOE72170.1 hypothetical protein BZG23_15195 [Salinivibrio sp. ML290]
MRRIYLEFFFGLIVIFMVSSLTYEYLVYELTENYEATLAKRQAESVVDMLALIESQAGTQKALGALKGYADNVEYSLSVHQLGTIPSHLNGVFSHQLDPSAVFDDKNETLWFRLADKEQIYSLRTAVDSELHGAIEFNEDLLFVFLFFGFALYSFFMVRFLSRRVRSLEQAALQFASGNLEARASTKSQYTVGSLNATFNHMADRIASLVSSRRALTNAVAHELRSPLFRIQWQAELLSESQLGPKQQQRIVSIVEDTDEMVGLIDELLYLARVDHPNTPFNSETLNTAMWLHEEWPRWQTLSTQSVSLDAPQNLPSIEADPPLLKRVLTNLIGNAEKYATSQIAVRVYCEDTQLVIAVHDDGEGVDPSHWPFIFDAFYSADRSRDKKRSGYGLGLAIVKQIVTRHGGHVEIDHSDLGGACFRVILPMKT